MEDEQTDPADQDPTATEHSTDPGNEEPGGSANIEPGAGPRTGEDVAPPDPNEGLQLFQDLLVPAPAPPDPPASARWLAFASVLLGGVLGALVGFGVGDVMGQNSTWAAAGALVGAVTGAAGLGVLANLTLRAMAEWEAVEHPEAKARPNRRSDRQWSRRTSGTKD